MEGINPTLTFLALILGMSGNARDAANDTAAATQIDSVSGCPVLAIASDPPEPIGPAATFWDNAAGATVLPDVINPEWEEFAEIKASEPTGDAVPALEYGSDPIKRYTVPAGSTPATDAERDPCGPER